MPEDGTSKDGGAAKPTVGVGEAPSRNITLLGRGRSGTGKSFSLKPAALSICVRTNCVLDDKSATEPFHPIIELCLFPFPFRSLSSSHPPRVHMFPS